MHIHEGMDYLQLQDQLFLVPCVIPQVYLARGPWASQRIRTLEVLRQRHMK